MRHRLAANAVLLTFACMHGLVAADDWGYEGSTGPEHWGRLKWDYALCEQGVHQSPIDLTGASEIRFADLERVAGSVEISSERQAEILDLLDNGHTVQVQGDASVSLSVGGEHYSLLQFHFHSPSEHTIDGRQYPLEAHFVMGNKAGHLAVFGYLFEEGSADPDYDPLVAALPKAPGDARRLDGLGLGIEKLKPLEEAFFAYPGSLTTPPCSEGVRWLVAATPRQLSQEQLEAFDSVLHGNARPVQPRHVRALVRIESNARQ